MHEVVTVGETPQVPRSSIQVEKNSRGWNWTVKLYQSEGESDEDLLIRVHNVNHDLQAAYGGGE